MHLVMILICFLTSIITIQLNLGWQKVFMVGVSQNSHINSGPRAKLLSCVLCSFSVEYSIESNSRQNVSCQQMTNAIELGFGECDNRNRSYICVATTTTTAIEIDTKKCFSLPIAFTVSVVFWSVVAKWKSKIGKKDKTQAICAPMRTDKK